MKNDILIISISNRKLEKKEFEQFPKPIECGSTIRNSVETFWGATKIHVHKKKRERVEPSSVSAYDHCARY